MRNHTPPTKKQLLQMIDALAKAPHDKVRLLGDVGITATGVGLGAAAAGTVATLAGVNAIAGLTAIAGWVGITATAATPVGWVIGTAAVGGVLAYGISRLIHGGGLSEGRTLELLQEYRERAREIAAKEATDTLTDTDRTQFVISLRELIDKAAITPEQALRLVMQVEQGHLPLSQASALVQALLTQTPQTPA